MKKLGTLLLLMSETMFWSQNSFAYSCSCDDNATGNNCTLNADNGQQYKFGFSICNSTPSGSGGSSYSCQYSLQKADDTYEINGTFTCLSNKPVSNPASTTASTNDSGTGTTTGGSSSAPAPSGSTTGGTGLSGMLSSASNYISNMMGKKDLNPDNSYMGAASQNAQNTVATQGGAMAPPPAKGPIGPPMDNGQMATGGSTPPGNGAAPISGSGVMPTNAATINSPSTSNAWTSGSNPSLTGSQPQVTAPGLNANNNITGPGGPTNNDVVRTSTTGADGSITEKADFGDHSVTRTTGTNGTVNEQIRGADGNLQAEKMTTASGTTSTTQYNKDGSVQQNINNSDGTGTSAFNKSSGTGDHDGAGVNSQANAAGGGAGAGAGNGSGAVGGSGGGKTPQNKNDADPTDPTLAEQRDQNKDNANTHANRKEGRAIGNAMDIQKNGGDKDSYCGRYGGADCDATKGINSGIQMGIGIANQVGTATTQNQGSAATQALGAKGMTATNSDYYNAQADLALKAAQTDTTIGAAESGFAAIQVVRMAQHMSTKKISAAQQASNDSLDIEEARLDPQNDPEYAEKKKDIERRRQNTLTNGNKEIKAQKNMAMLQAVQTAVTAGAAGMMFINAKMMRDKAAALKADANMAGTTPTPPPFVYNPPPPPTNGSTDPGATPTPDASAVSAPDATTASTAGDTPLNPNLGDNSTNSPQASNFQGAAAPAGGSGGGSGGGGGPGNTSAAKDESKAEAVAAGKSQTGSGYASEGAGGAKKSGGSAGGGVGVDPNFSDMLKKLLDGAGDKNADAKDGLDKEIDRGPAGDSAAVLGRNTNIFEAIHKRYVKKHGEGAIIYGEGSS